MQPGRALSDWLADKAGHAAALERTARARAHCDALAPVARFDAALAGSEDGEAVAGALDMLFETPGWVEALLVRWIAEARRDPFFAPPCRAVSGPFHAGLLVLERAEATVALSVVDPVALAARKREGGGRGSVHFTGRRSFLKFLDGGGMRLAFWRAPMASEDVASFATVPCERLDERAVATGDLVAVDTRHTSYIIESAARPAVFLHGEVRIGGAVLAREYDAATHRLIGVSSSADHWSRIQMMLSWLGRSGDPRAGAAIVDAMRDAPFFVRWHAMREWLAHDPAGALPALARMAEADPHDEVRATARQTLAQLPASEAA